ncbi:threonine--tRNA ligase [Candidatus Peregrinibacteria bacterium]|nr:threonine--tRNA ligase [Candidatus Peregrinibacteria bacterium]
MSSPNILSGKDQELDHMRHSCAHILAQAVLDMFPEAKLAIGPTTDDGFYYDFDLPRTLIPEDLDILQEKMEQIAKDKQSFKRVDGDIDKAIDFYKKAGQPFKVEILEDLKKEGENNITFYENLDAEQNVKFVDLCKGGHVEDTSKSGAFKLHKIAGAYWRGDENKPMLQRIYGLCFKDKKALKVHMQMLEEAKKRDHRKLGKELELFDFNEHVGPGLPLWLPNGAVLVEELEKLAKEEEFKDGYERLRTPHITKGKLYEMSGHLDHYKDSMYAPMKTDGEDYYLKPMNCPHHHMCFKSNPKSYRDLPVRFAEYGTCYRYEDSGALFGLMRVRSLQMNDAHIYCTEDQFLDEFIKVTKMYLRYFELFGIEKYVMRLSLHSKEGLGKKYLNEPELWGKTEEMVRNAMKKAGVEYIEVEDEAAFYGPKIDIEVWSAIGREFTLATNQVDFGVPAKMGLAYTDENGQEQVPLCIHRAPLSTHERFIGFLIEHYAGAFPTWLAPVQVRVLPVSDKFLDYATELAEKMRGEFVRVEVDDSKEGLGKKIRNAELKKIPYMLVVGEKEVADNKVAARNYKTKKQVVVDKDVFIDKVLDEIKKRSSTPFVESM